ncbi:MAG: hypothetical protein BGO67_01880 [Alphaproteobacteria bacterium 41-28]|nr:MAG: hypothetical protein BGO67_01880 [Alphaproteobacteria bacterium 41-28]
MSYMVNFKKLKKFFIKGALALTMLSGKAFGALPEDIDSKTIKITKTKRAKAIEELKKGPHSYDDFVKVASFNFVDPLYDDESLTTGTMYGPPILSVFAQAVLDETSPDYYHTPDQGWKLHVTAPLDHLAEVVEAISPVLYQKNIYHKIVSSIANYMRLEQSKTQKGKVITIYPKNDTHAAEIAKLLDETVLNLGLPRVIFSTPPYEAIVGESGAISARYGGFKGYLLNEVDRQGIQAGGRIADERDGSGWKVPYKPDFVNWNPFMESGLRFNEPRVMAAIANAPAPAPVASSAQPVAPQPIAQPAPAPVASPAQPVAPVASPIAAPVVAAVAAVAPQASKKKAIGQKRTKKVAKKRRPRIKVTKKRTTRVKVAKKRTARAKVAKPRAVKKVRVSKQRSRKARTTKR